MPHLYDGLAGPARARGVALLLHGGAEHNDRAVAEDSLQLRRMRWLMGHVEGRLARAGVASLLLRFTVVGWNASPDAAPAPLADVAWALERVRDRHPDLPVVLLGHSMGARAAAWSAGDPSVVGVVGLAPWFPADDPVDALAGRHLVAAHGRTDQITSARATRRFVERAGDVAASARFIDRGRIGHYLLRDIAGWNALAVAETLAIIDRIRTAD